MRKNILLSTLLTSFLYADTAPVAPESPGIQLQKLNEIDKSAKGTQKSAIVENLKVDKSAEGKGENRIKGPSFILTNVSVTGNTVMDQKEIIDIIKPFVSKSVDSIDLKYIAQKITSLYKSKGYLTSECIIPAQKVQNGMVKFAIKEDKLGRIIMKGKTKYNYDSNIFMKYLADLQGKIINADELNRQLKYLSNLPVTRIKPSLQKTNNGYTNIILEIIESKENFSVSLDNSGSIYTGKNRMTINGHINNIRGRGDSLNLSLTTVEKTENLTSLSLSYIHPYGREGGKINYFLSKMNYMMKVPATEDMKNAVTGDVTDMNLYYQGTSSSYGLRFTKPLYDLSKINVNYTFGFENRTTQIDDAKILFTVANGTEASYSLKDVFNNSGKAAEDKNFVINTGINIGKVDNIFGSKYMGYNSASLSIQKGLEGFLNTSKSQDISIYDKNNIREDSAMDFLKYYYTFNRQQQIPYETTMNINFSGSYTKDRVPDSYEYSGGDYGYAYSMSLARKFWFINSSLSLSQSKVYTHELDGSVTKVTNSPSAGVGLNTSFYDLYLGLSYSSSIDTWDSNTNNIRFKLKYNW